MKRFKDESGWVRVLVCFAVLLVHHGLRDSLITALPNLAAASTTSPSSPSPAPQTTSSTPDQAYRSDTTDRNTNLAVNVAHTNITSRKTLEATVPGLSILTVLHTLPLSDSEKESSGAAVTIHSFPTDVPSLTASQGPWVAATVSEGSYQSEINSLPFDASSDKQKVDGTNSKDSKSHILLHSQNFEATDNEVNDDVLKNDGEGYNLLHEQITEATDNGVNDDVFNKDDKSESVDYVLPKPPLFAYRADTHRTKYATLLKDNSAVYKHERERVKLRGRKAVLGSPSQRANWRTTEDLSSGRGGEEEEEEEEEVFEEEKIQSFSLPSHQLKEEWSMVLEGLVLSSVYWGWLFTGLLADPLMDRAGVGVVMAVSLGMSGLLGLFTHAASLGGPWALLGLRVVQGTAQGVSYPVVVRVLEGVPSTIRAPAALLVFLGPSVGTGLGAGLGSLPQWYIATYVLGSLALVLTPLCLMVPPPPDAAPHKEMHWKHVLSCRGVWACVGVHVANTWMLYTLLVGLPFCLIYTHLEQPSISGLVVAAAAVTVCVVVRLHLFLASKLTGKRPTTALNRRRIPVVAGTVMVTAAVIVMATAGLDSVEVLVGVGVALAGLGIGVARVGYRLNVDDMAPLGAWRLTKILDAAAVVTAALSPVVVSALAQAGTNGWVSVWLVPLAALLPAAAIHLFLLTSNPQPWDQTDRATGAAVNGAAVGGAVGVPVNGAPTLSIGRQSFKSAQSALTFKTARSRTRTRTLSCRTVDDDLEGDMYSVANSNLDYRSVADEKDQECISVASSSTFKSDGADMHSVEEGEGAVTPGKHTGKQFGSMLVNGATADRTSVWLSSHHDLVLEAGREHATTTRADTHAANAIYALLW